LKTLAQINLANRGRATDKWRSYLDTYDKMFGARRRAVKSMLEIGVQNGGSLEVWAEYFADAQKIVGCDIDPKCGDLTFSDLRISVVVGDATAADTRKRILRESPTFDLIIDDGSHRSSDIIRSFAQYFGPLNDGGLYIVEDLHCSYWATHEGGLDCGFTAMEFLKALADLLNQEHWPVELARSEYVSDFARAFEVSLDEADLASIHSITFSNSMCVIAKESPQSNRLGKRVVTGQIEDVLSGTLGFNGSELVTPKAEWSNSAQNTRLAQSERELSDLRREYEELKKRHFSLLKSRSWRLTRPLRSIENGIRALLP
jgi:O-antigen biosynthesis protein